MPDVTGYGATSPEVLDRIQQGQDPFAAQTGKPAQVSEDHEGEQKVLRQKYETWKARVRMGEMVPPAVQQWMKMIESHYPGWK